MAWLSEVRRGARARPVEARLELGDGGYRGRITVAIGAAHEP
jgi:general secretion pathway protein M